MRALGRLPLLRYNGKGMDLSGPTHEQMASKAAQNAARLEQHLRGQLVELVSRGSAGGAADQTSLLLNDAIESLAALLQVLAKERDQL
jgi:hypothetical protein